MNSSGSKSALRRQLLEQRRTLAAETLDTLTHALSSHLLQALDERELDTIAGFSPINGEPLIFPALVRLYELGHSICLPVVHPESAGEMQFHQWHPDATMHPNRFGIDEPVGTPAWEIEDLNLILAPLLAFTPNGMRLGMGGGYYDRSLARLNRDHNNRKGTQAEPHLTKSGGSPLVAGIGFAHQQVETVHPDPWDQPLDAVITENGWFTFER